MHRYIFRAFISSLLLLIGLMLVGFWTAPEAKAAGLCFGMQNPTARQACYDDAHNDAIEICKNRDGITQANFLACVQAEEQRILAQDPVSASTPVGSGGAGGADALTCSEVDGQNLVSENGLIRYLCFLNPSSAGRNAIEVLIEGLANLLVLLTVLLFSVMLTLAMIQLGVSGGSPAAITAAKKRILLSVTSIALLWLGRLILTLTGVVGGQFLGVDVKNGNFADPAFLASLITAILNYLRFTGGALAVIMIIFGGIRMITSAGNPKAIEQAKKIITFAIISIIVIAGTVLIQAVIQLIITGSYGF